MIYGKLVRDKVEPRKGETEQRLHPSLHRAALINKLHEEVEEVARDPKNIDEYADVLEALQTLAWLNGFSEFEIEEARIRKERERGGFELGRFIYSNVKCLLAARPREAR